MDNETNTYLGITITLLLILLGWKLLIGCTPPDDVAVDYDDSRRSAIEAWEEVIGRVSDECYDRTIDAMVTETGRFPESCMPPLELGTYIGCYTPTELFGFGGDIIFIYEGRTKLQKKDTAVHEYIHLLSYCELGGDALLVHNPDAFLDILSECASYAIEGRDFPDMCADIPGDYFHLDRRLWDRYGPDTVEAVGCAGLDL